MNIVDLDEEEIKGNIKKVRKTLDDMPEIEDLSDYEQKESITKDESEQEGSLGKEIISLITNVAICFIIVFLITHFVGQRIVVSGSSMEDTLSDGDNLIVDRLSYRFHDPERFDIVIFPFEDDVYYIKRIIGLPGETVNIDFNGTIYINGQRLIENYGTEVIADPGVAYTEIILGPDEYFVLGDNRNNSTDSRFQIVGNIKGEDIIGKAWVRIYPFNEMCFIDNLE